MNNKIIICLLSLAGTAIGSGSWEQLPNITLESEEGI